MNQTKIENYKKKLELERTGLMKELEKDQVPEDFGSDVDHFEEEASEAESLSNKLAAGQDIKERINDIDRALDKIRTGEYGPCEMCGGEIEEKILNISPESRFCKNCKKKEK